MQKIIELLENTENQNILAENKELVNYAIQDLSKFYTYMNKYINENIEEFLEENLEETSKSIYTFATFATKQFLCEVSNYYGKQMHTNQVLKEAARNEFC